MAETTGIAWTDSTDVDSVEWIGAGLRFWAKVDVRAPEECWPWLGAIDRSTGYGAFGLNVLGYRQTTASRAAYVLTHGFIAEGLQPDHRCRNRRCVNPAHLEAVTNQENTLRGLRGRMVVACKQGHAYMPENTGRRKNGRRVCLTCLRHWGSNLHRGRDAAYWRELSKSAK